LILEKVYEDGIDLKYNELKFFINFKDIKKINIDNENRKV
jgi:hypothetical protein